MHRPAQHSNTGKSKVRKGKERKRKQRKENVSKERGRNERKRHSLRQPLITWRNFFTVGVLIVLQITNPVSLGDEEIENFVFFCKRKEDRTLM